jgi:glycosyltransferase involved in cell wall biosynthesis
VTLRATRILVYSAQLEAVGGIESHVQELCVRMAAAGQQVTLLSSRSCLDSRTKDRLQRAGVTLELNESRWFSGSAARKWIWTLGTLARLSLRKFDVVYTNGQGLNPVTVMAWFRGRARLVHHHHTSCDANDIAQWPPAYRRAMHAADALIVCAGFIRQRMQAAIGRDDVQVTYCFSRNVSPVSRQRDPQSVPQVVFGYFGRLNDAKGVDWILRLSRETRLAGIRWKLWGSEGQYRSADFEPYPNVSYHGPFSDEAGLREALGAIDCFVLFSTTPEGLPVSLMEVMATGTPWIATAQGGIPEIAHDPASCVLVSLDDMEQVIRACLEMQARIVAGQIDRAGQQAFHAARFSDRILLARWLDLLNDPNRANA